MVNYKSTLINGNKTIINVDTGRKTKKELQNITRELKLNGTTVLIETEGMNDASFASAIKNANVTPNHIVDAVNELSASTRRALVKLAISRNTDFAEFYQYGEVLTADPAINGTWEPNVGTSGRWFIYFKDTPFALMPETLNLLKCILRELV